MMFQMKDEWCGQFNYKLICHDLGTLNDFPQVAIAILGKITRIIDRNRTLHFKMLTYATNYSYQTLQNHCCVFLINENKSIILVNHDFIYLKNRYVEPAINSRFSGIHGTS